MSIAALSNNRQWAVWVILLLAVFSSLTYADSATHVSPDVVSLDYCADQFVLELLPRERILALSNDALKYFSYHRTRAIGIQQVSARAESVLALKPKIVVRSYGGGPNAMRFFQRLGIQVVQLGYPQTLNDIPDSILSVGTQLDVIPRANEVIAGFEQRLQKLQTSNKGLSTLYTTPGGVTTGPGSLIHEAILAAGLNNYQTKAGWHPLPLERLVIDKPELLAAGWFGEPGKAVDPWSLVRHPHVTALNATVPSVELPGAWTSCGAWFLLDAVDAMVTAAGSLNDSAQTTEVQPSDVAQDNSVEEQAPTKFSSSSLTTSKPRRIK